MSLSSPNLRSISIFVVDSGSEINLIKENCLLPNNNINYSDQLSLQGIDHKPTSTLGSLTISLVGQKTKFHVLPSDASFIQDGILGTEFLIQHRAKINFEENNIQCSNFNIPFNATSQIIPIEPRTVSPFYVVVANPEVKQGYIPRMDYAKGIIIGDALISNDQGKAFLPLFNTTDEKFELPITAVTLQDYNTIDDPGDNFSSLGLKIIDDRPLDHIPEALSPTTLDTYANSACGTENSVSGPSSTIFTDTPANSASGTYMVSGPSPSFNSFSESSQSIEPSTSMPSYDSTNDTDTLSDVCQVFPLYENSPSTSKHSLLYEPVKNIPNQNEISPLNTTIATTSTTRPFAECNMINSYEYIVNESVPLEQNFPFDRAKSIKKLLRLEHLNNEEKASVEKIIEEHSDRFQLPEDRLNITSATKHSIPTTNEVPIHVKQYRFPPVHKIEIDKQVNELLNNDIIEYSTSPYNSPLWIVPKKPDSHGNKRWRMVIDYRLLNEKTIGDAYPLPNIIDILDQLGNAKYFSILDLASGFHQIPMTNKDAPKTAFSTPYGHYQFKRMPFGLKNAPATFQRLMDNVLSGLQGNELFVYMDDIVIYATSLKEHSVKFNRLMKRLKEANLKLQPDKCEFLRREVIYLGHIIGSHGVKPDPKKIEAIKNFPIPNNEKNIKQFLGLAGYYRRFIRNFSKIAKPLTDLLKKDRQFKWETMQQESFNYLRTALCTEPILQYPDFTKIFNLTTDASGYAIGGVLSQGPVGKDLPIAYTSRVLNSAEQKYSTIEKECLAIVYCTTYFRPYLYGRKFIIITDHKPLVWLNSIKDPSSRLWKWRTKLSEYEFEITYKKGKLNSNADALSRNPPSNQTLIINANPFDLDPNSASKSPFPVLNRTIQLSLSPPHNFETVPDPINLPYDVEHDVTRLDTRNSTIETHTDSASSSPIPPLNSEKGIESLQRTIHPINLLHSSPNISSISDSESTDSDEELFEPESIPTYRDQNEPNPLVTFFETRDQLFNKIDNHVIFISLQGTAYCDGAKEYTLVNKLPEYNHLTFERARVTKIGTKLLIALPIKLNEQIRIETTNIKNCIKSLLDVATELRLKTFSIRETRSFDDIPWEYVYNKIKSHFAEISIKITICKGIIHTPANEERNEIINENHSGIIGGHKGVNKTYNRIRMNYYWGTLKQDIQKFIQRCKICQLKKLTRIKTKQPMIITDTPGAAFDKISMDIVGPLPTTPTGHTHILTIQDLLTKYSIAVPLRSTNSLNIANAFMKNFICIYGAPRALLTDQGSNFLSSLMRNLAKKLKIKQFRTTAYHPQSNGSIERSHHVLMEYLRTQIDEERNWNKYIHLAMFSYNTSVHESTKHTPFELVFGRIPRLPSSTIPLEENLDLTYKEYLTNLFNKLWEVQEKARQNLILSKQKSKLYYDQRLNTYQFKQGNMVYLLKEPRKGKFLDQYTGPHQVMEVLKNNNVRIKYKNTSKVVHTNKLKIAHIDPG